MAELIQQGEFMTVGEEKTARHLRDNLPVSWKIIANKVMPFTDARVYEIDLIILGDNLLFVLDEKGWRGKVHGDANYWQLESGETRDNPLNKLEMIARKLAGQMCHHVPYLSQNLGQAHFVDAIIVFSDDTAELLIQEPRRNRILKLSACAAALKKMDKAAEATSLASYRDDILDRLNLLKRKDSLPRQVDKFRITETLPPGPHYRAFMAEHEAGGKDAKRRLKMYRMDGLTADERKKQEELVYRDYHALMELAETGLAPRADSPFTWSDSYVVVAQQVFNLPTLRGVSAKRDESLSFPDVLQIAERLLSGITAIHAKETLHRNLTPDNIFIDQESKPPRVRFADFDFARVPNSQTIAAKVNEMSDDSPYRAPELAIGAEFATYATDVYAAGVAIIELFTNQSAMELRNDTGKVDCPPLIFDDPHLTGNEIVHLRDILNAMITPDYLNRMQTASEAHEFIAGLMQDYAARKTPVLSAPSPVTSNETPSEKAKLLNPAITPSFSPGKLYQAGDRLENRYKIERVLGQGATANAYLAYDEVRQDNYVLKQLREPLEAGSQAYNEFKTLKNLRHRGVMKVEEIYASDKPFQLKLEYIEGNSLDYLIQSGEFPWTWERVISFSDAALDALDYLEKHNIAHRDVSARNILLTPEGQPKLIDFGFAASLVNPGQTVVGTPAYRAPEIDRGEGWNKTCDTYALGVALYQMLTGEPPFHPNLNGILNKSVLPAPLEPETGDRNAFSESETRKAILRAIDPEKGNRYGSAQEFRDALQNAGTQIAPTPTDGERVISEWVKSIQGLYRNSGTGNADNRGLDSKFSRDTYVKTKLDARLMPRLLDNQDAVPHLAVVLLSGNPGDGKTAFLEMLRDELERRHAKRLHDDDNGWQYILNGQTYAANYDASESHNGKRADELLDEILAPLTGDVPPKIRYTALLAINDGKLRGYFLQNRERYGWLASHALNLLKNPEAPTDSRVAFVDLKQRTVVGETTDAGQSDLFAQTLEKLLKNDAWQVCDNCLSRAVCSMKFNRDSLVDPNSGATIQARLRTLFQIVQLRREKHMTMRDLRSTLAYIVAGTATCEDVHRERETTAIPTAAINRLYFMAAFNPEKEGDETLRHLAEADPGFVPAPRFDRFLHFRRSGHRQAEIAALLPPLILRSDLPLQVLTPLARPADWPEATKRRAYFEGEAAHFAGEATPLPPPLTLLPYRHFSEFLDAVSERSSLDILRDKLCEAISRANGIAENTNGFLMVRTISNQKNDLTVFKRFPTTDFVCEIVRPANPQVETLPNALRLHSVGNNGASLLVSLDLFEILMRFNEGYCPGVEEQEPFVIHLVQFQNRLLNERANELLLLEGGRIPYHVRQSNGKIELLPEGEKR
ncbi:MAG: hypothetical protein JWL77_1762 [Chthonomonadaceae bacterium]|nr:hypothetical protein [Chthonomonadaceae bacterium]